MRILLAEDDASIAGLVVELLSGEGYDVTVSSSAGQTLRLVMAEGWNLCISDTFGQTHAQPDPGDISYFQALAARVPVIVATARPWAAQLAAADLGVAAIFLKPFDLNQFLEAVQRLSA